MNQSAIVKTNERVELKSRTLPPFRTMLKPIIPAAILFLITFIFTIIFSQLSRIFLDESQINYVNRGLVLASIFAFVLLTIKLSTIVKNKTEYKH